MSLLTNLAKILFPNSSADVQRPSLLDGLPHLAVPDENEHLPGHQTPPADTGPDVLAPGTVHSAGQLTKSS